MLLAGLRLGWGARTPDTPEDRPEAGLGEGACRELGLQEQLGHPHPYPRAAFQEPWQALMETQRHTDNPHPRQRGSCSPWGHRKRTPWAKALAQQGTGVY